MTAFATQTLQSIQADRKQRRDALKARGVRDVITIMTWPSGLVEVTGEYTRGQFGTNRTHPDLVSFVRSCFGNGTLRRVESDSIEGRPTVTYEVI